MAATMTGSDPWTLAGDDPWTRAKMKLGDPSTPDPATGFSPALGDPSAPGPAVGPGPGGITIGDPNGPTPSPGPTSAPLGWGGSPTPAVGAPPPQPLGWGGNPLPAAGGDPLAQQDIAGRGLAAQLSADGHQVAWGGDTGTDLLVDGKAYAVATSNAAAAPQIDQPPPVTTQPSTDPSVPGPTPDFPAPPASSPAPSSAPPAAGNLNWATQALQDVESTDDPAYWYAQIQKDPAAMAGDPSAIAWWVDAIRRGDGSKLVKNGTLTKRDAGSGSPGAGGNIPDVPDLNMDAFWEKARKALGDPIDPTQYSNDVLALRNKILGDADPTETSTDALVRNIVEHPSTLDDRTVDMMKAQSAEENAAAAQATDAELQHYGYSSGLDTSPWLAGQRASNAFGARTATTSANRTIDIGAAAQRNSDRQAAAAIGQSWTAFKSSRSQSATQIAATIKQQAAQLGISQEQLLVSYATQAAGLNLDTKKLQQQSAQFKADLALRIKTLAQADDQFKARYGLDLASFDLDAQKFDWQKKKDIYNLGSPA